jgi:hypothetical protein
MLIKQLLAVGPTDIVYSPVRLDFAPPNLQDILTFAIRILFVIAGLAALLFLLLGALAWITSGGNKESVEKARDKIMHAVIGLILIFVVIAVAVLMENVLFPGDCGLGISRSICVPTLIHR